MVLVMTMSFVFQLCSSVTLSFVGQSAADSTVRREAAVSEVKGQTWREKLFKLVGGQWTAQSNIHC